MSEYDWYDGDGNPGDVLRRCLVAASSAPSIHNTQPWLFRPRGNDVDVLVDRRRQLATLDPDGREMFVSVGAAVFTLRTDIRAHGRNNRVSFLPDPAEPDLAARVTLEGEAVPTAAMLALAEANGRRHTNRHPFTHQPVPDDIIDELAAAASLEQVLLIEVDPPLREGVLSLTRTAEIRMRADPRYRAELAAWTTPSAVGRRDGVPREAFGPRDNDGGLPLREFAVGRGAPTTTVAFEPDPTLILLYTSGDTPTDWLHAGSALQRVWLTATLHGLAATPLSQSLEVPKLRAMLDNSANRHVVQTVLRIGYPTTAALPTPRRRINDVVVADSEHRPQ